MTAKETSVAWTYITRENLVLPTVFDITVWLVTTTSTQQGSRCRGHGKSPEPCNTVTRSHVRKRKAFSHTIPSARHLGSGRAVPFTVRRKGQPSRIEKDAV